MDIKVKMISAIAIIIVLVIIGILLIFFFITESKCQCSNNDFDSFVGTWKALSTPRTETTYYLNGSWETKYLDISRTYNGTWEIKNNSIIKTRYMGEPYGMNIPIEYGYEFLDDCNQLKMWNRSEEGTG